MKLAWLIAGGAVAGAAVLAVRSRRAAASGGGLCDKAAQLDPRAGAACQVAAGLLGALGEALPDGPGEVAAENARLNGPTDPAHPAVRAIASLSMASGTPGGSDIRPPIEPAERYKNGCVPAPGNPGWSKCAPGTRPQWWDLGRYTSGAVAAMKSAAANAFTGSAGDPYHRRHPATIKRAGKDVPAPAFPLAVPPGHSAWWDRGQPRVCPPATVLQGTGGAPVDHRPGAPRCVPAPASSSGNWWDVTMPGPTDRDHTGDVDARPVPPPL